MVRPVIIQVVGYQNSGKTTYVKKLIEQLSKMSLRVATIKHHGHGGKPKVVNRKDSSEHVESGAIASLVEGEGRLLLQVEKEEWTLQEKVQLLHTMNPDVILIEGHKRENYPKIVLLRGQEDFEELKYLCNVLAFVSRDSSKVEADPFMEYFESLTILINYIEKCSND